MTDRNDGRPRHSASHIHCAVPFFVPEAERRGRQGGAAGGRAKVFGGEWVVRSVGVRRRSLRVCVWAAGRGSGSARGGGEKVLGKGVSLCGGGRRSSAGNVVRSAGVHRCCEGNASALRGGRKCSGRACRCAGGEQIFDGEWVVRSARNAWRSLRVCAWAVGMWQEGRGRE